MAKNREALLKKEVWEYDESCPGCKIDHLKESNPGIPFKLLFYVWIVVLCAALPISSLFPFLYFMIRDFHIAKREEDIGFYAGYVGSSFMFGRALTSVIWGMVADRYGRKPVITAGLIALIIFNTLFGLSTNVWMALSTRNPCLKKVTVSLQGKDSALFRRLELGLMLGRPHAFAAKLRALISPSVQFAYASEVCRKEYQALGMSIISTAWGIGLVIGPALGGFLAQQETTINLC
ncbi:Protein zinc induced facilitator-like 1 [Vitis vinifera]|uniref:Protein zinc induced facilitator-like 1 n=1 Tax=Vitis vinifera TaxID=29760 RepID=A0A438J7J8_VITVI|nr:Protein zinc induced facilitator-like 1 [Vitis vinifera]